MKTIYRTNDWDGYGKQNRYHNEYRLDGDEVEKVKVHDQRSFDGEESAWHREETLLDSWQTDDPSMPGWLRKYL